MPKKPDLYVDVYWNDYQAMFLECPAKHKALFAEFRSGKTKAWGSEIFKMALDYPGITIGVIRNIHQELVTSTIPQLKAVYDWDYTGEQFNKTDKILRFKNGSLLICFALDRPDDVKKLKNVELGYVAGDQAEEIHPDVIEMAMGRLSQPKMPNKSSWVGNFEGKGEIWYRFFQNPLDVKVGKFSKGGVTKERDYGTYCGINKDWIGIWPPPFLNEANLPENYYEELIQSHSEAWVDKYVWGLPVGNAGLIHKDFNEQRHLIRAENYFNVPKNMPYVWETYEGMDYGVSNPTCWLFVAYSRVDDTIYFLDEYYQGGENIYFHGPKIKKFREEYGNPAWTIGCPAAFQTERDGKNPASEYLSKYNIALSQYPVGVETRIEIVNRRFKQNKIKIFDRCQFLKRQLEGTTWKNMENVENHALEPFHRIVCKIDADSSSRKMQEVLRSEPVRKIDKPITAGALGMDF
jgi:hypothetical protein